MTENDLLTYASGTVAAVGGVVFGLQKIMKMWSSDKKDIYKNNVETDLFQRLSDETKRLHEQNVNLSKTIEHLREELGKLHEEITTLRIENSTLRKEITALHDELGEIRHGQQFADRFSNTVPMEITQVDVKL
jgi:uncharacterized coiled-coil DUF342 family protein